MPSILLAITLAPFLYYAIDQVPSQKFPDGTFEELIKYVAVIIFLPLGYLYDLLQLRRLLNRASLERINRYVEDQLRLTLQPLVSIHDLQRAPVGDRRWMRLLYKQVDSDPTLTELAKRIRDNGIRWTTVADIAVIFIPGGVVLGLLGSFNSRTHIVLWALGLVLVGFAASLLIPTVERRHLALCQDQQDHIRGFLTNQLVADFRKIFS